MKLSFNDKCWLVANIKKVMAPPSAILFFIIFIVSADEGKKGIKTPFETFGLWSILMLIVMGVIALRYAYKIARYAEANYDQVLSRRTKWKSSNVELHEMKYRFVLETFGWALFSIFTPLFTIIWFLIYLIY